MKDEIKVLIFETSCRLFRKSKQIKVNLRLFFTIENKKTLQITGSYTHKVQSAY